MNYTTAFVLRHAGHAPLRKVARCPLFPKMARWATVFSGILRIMFPLRKNVLSLKMCSKGKRRPSRSQRRAEPPACALYKYSLRQKNRFAKTVFVISPLCSQAHKKL